MWLPFIRRSSPVFYAQINNKSTWLPMYSPPDWSTAKRVDVGAALLSLADEWTSMLGSLWGVVWTSGPLITRLQQAIMKAPPPNSYDNISIAWAWGKLNFSGFKYIFILVQFWLLFVNFHVTLYIKSVMTFYLLLLKSTVVPIFNINCLKGARLQSRTPNMLKPCSLWIILTFL